MALKELPPYCVLVEKRSIIPAEPQQKPDTKPVSNLLDIREKRVQPVFVSRQVEIPLSEESGVHVVVRIKPPEIETIRRN